LEVNLPVGFCWGANGKIEKDPDQRVQRAIEMEVLQSWATGLTQP
jgi:hypothetical protein